jgi:hypothetical protein
VPIPSLEFGWGRVQTLPKFGFRSEAKDTRGWCKDLKDELIDGIVAHVGIDRSPKVRSLSFSIFCSGEGPSDKVQALMDRLPDAAVVQAARVGGDPGGILSGVMGVGSRLLGTDLGMQQIRSVTGELIAHTREQASNEVVEVTVGAIPGLGQFI